MPRSSSADDKILSYNDVVLRQSDLTILNGPYFLNDRLIEFYFSYLSTLHPSEHILLVPPSITFWIMNCPDTNGLKDFLQPLNLPSKNLIFFPVNDNDDVAAAEGGSHWSLLAFERSSNVFVHHDSYHGMNKNYAKRLYRTLDSYTGVSGARYVECESSPQQKTGYDCGLYVLAIAKEICEWFDCDVPKNEDLWFARVEERVTTERVSGLRGEILGLITSLRGTK